MAIRKDYRGLAYYLSNSSYKEDMSERRRDTINQKYYSKKGLGEINLYSVGTYENGCYITSYNDGEYLYCHYNYTPRVDNTIVCQYFVPKQTKGALFAFYLSGEEGSMHCHFLASVDLTIVTIKVRCVGVDGVQTFCFNKLKKLVRQTQTNSGARYSLDSLGNFVAQVTVYYK